MHGSNFVGICWRFWEEGEADPIMILPGGGWPRIRTHFDVLSMIKRNKFVPESVLNLRNQLIDVK